MPAHQGDRVRFDGATLRKDEDGLRELVIDDAVDIERIEDDDSSSGPDETDTPDTLDKPDTPAENDGQATADGGIVRMDTDGTDTDNTQSHHSETSDQDNSKESTGATDLSQNERKGKIQAVFTMSDGHLTADELADELGWRVNEVEATLKPLVQRGSVIESPEGYNTI